MKNSSFEFEIDETVLLRVPVYNPFSMYMYLMELRLVYFKYCTKIIIIPIYTRAINYQYKYFLIRFYNYRKLKKIHKKPKIFVNSACSFSLEVFKYCHVTDNKYQPNASKTILLHLYLNRLQLLNNCFRLIVQLQTFKN